MEQRVFSGKVENLYKVIEFVKAIAETKKASFDCSRLELAIEEIFVNIASYAFEDSKGEVEVKCGIENDMLWICFADNGKPFDMTKAQAPDISSSVMERPMGGLGIYLVKEIMDEVHYKYTDGKNILTLGMKAI